MPRRIVDISVALKAGIVSDPPYMLPQINYVDHAAGALNFMQVFGVKKDQLPDGAGTGGRERRDLDPQRHASRRAVSLPSDDG